MLPGPVSPSGTESFFVTGMDAVVEATLYVFVKVRSLPCVTSADSVPSELSVTVTVTCFFVWLSLATPATEPDSVTVYLYVPGCV